MDRGLAIASSLHPAWHRCSPAARKLHARNSAIVLGASTDEPVDALVAWTVGGAVTGATGGQRMTTIVNMRDRPDLRRQLERCGEHAGVVRIDRRTRWGNPFRIPQDGTRTEVIARYRADLWQRIRSGEIALEDLADLTPRPTFCATALRCPATATYSCGPRNGPPPELRRTQ